MALDWPALQFQTPESTPAGVSFDGATYSLHQKRGQGYTWVTELPQATVNGTTCRSLGTSRIDGPAASTVTLTPSGSAWESVWTVAPSGGTPTWVGTRAHGYESDTSLAVAVDGGTVSPGATVTWGNEVVLTRRSDLTHPEAGSIGKAVTTYTLSREGLDVRRVVRWSTALTSAQCYAAMLPVLEALSTGKTLSGVKVALTLNNDSVNSSSQSATAWLWEPTGKHGVCMTLLDLSTVASWQYSDSKDLWLQDRAGGSMNKVYAGFTGRPIASGTVWTAHMRYLADYFDGGATATLDR